MCVCENCNKMLLKLLNTFQSQISTKIMLLRGRIKYKPTSVYEHDWVVTLRDVVVGCGDPPQPVDGLSLLRSQLESR
jgi:hypothetical protein